MTKKIITMAVVFAVILLSVGILYFLLNAPPPAVDPVPTTPVAETVMVLGDQSETIRASKITVTNEFGTYVLNVGNPERASQLDKNITVEGLEDYPTAALSVANVLSICQRMPSLAIVSETSESASTYGFDTPLAVVQIDYLDGISEELTIGGAAPGSSGYYAKTKSSDQIHLVNQTLREALLVDVLDLMDPRLTEALPEDTTFNDMTLSGTVRSEPIIIKRQLPDPTAEANMDLVASHVIVSPYEADIYSFPVTEILSPVFNLSAGAFAGRVDTEEDLEKFGLAEPYSVVTTSGQNIDEFTLYASEPRDGIVNVMKARTGLVYAVSANSMPWLTAQYHDLMNKYALVPYLTKVSRVTVATATDSYTFDISGDMDVGFTFSHKGAELDNKFFRQFYQNMIAASFDYMPEEPLPEDSKPILTYTYAYRDSGARADTLRFYNGPGRRMYISLNGRQAFLIPSTYVNRILEDLPKLLANEEVLPYQ